MSSGNGPLPTYPRCGASSKPATTDLRAVCSPRRSARRSNELSGGGFRPVPEPIPAVPFAMPGLSSRSSAGPVGAKWADAPSTASAAPGPSWNAWPDRGSRGNFAIAQISVESPCEGRAPVPGVDVPRRFLRGTHLEHGHGETLVIQKDSTASSAQRSTETLTDGGNQINSSVKSISGPFSLRRENTISKYPEALAAQGEASTVTTALHLRSSCGAGEGCYRDELRTWGKGRYDEFHETGFSGSDIPRARRSAGRGRHLSEQAGPHRRRLCRGFGLRPDCPHDRAEAGDRAGAAVRGRGAARRRQQRRGAVGRALAEGRLHAVRRHLIEHDPERRHRQPRVRLRDRSRSRSRCSRASRSCSPPIPGLA